MAASIVDVRDEEALARLLWEYRLVILDFWSPTCQPCRLVEEALERVSSRLGRDACIARINVVEAPGIAVSYRVLGLPTLIILKEGSIAKRITGAVGEDEILEALRSIEE